MAGLMAEFENGLTAMEVDSAVVSGLAIGASGRAWFEVEFLEASEATGLVVAGESVGAGSQRRRRAVDSNKVHLRVAAVVENADGSN